jgi:hypothetical protein
MSYSQICGNKAPKIKMSAMKKDKRKASFGRFRSCDLRVMSPALFRLATKLCMSESWPYALETSERWSKVLPLGLHINHNHFETL